MSRTAPKKYVPSAAAVLQRQLLLDHSITGMGASANILLENRHIWYCELCGQYSFDRGTHNKHLNRIHGQNVSPDGSLKKNVQIAGSPKKTASPPKAAAAEPEDKDKILKCPVDGCNRFFTSLTKLRNHKKASHTQVRLQTLAENNALPENIKLPFVCGYYKVTEKIRCKTRFKQRVELLQHLRDEHNMKCQEFKRTFPNEDAFKAWKKELEQKKGCRSWFVSTKGKRKYHSTIATYLECHRSGEFLSASRGERGARVKGSNKIGFNCSAYMKVNKATDTGKVQVIFCPEHYGHDFDEDRCPNPDGTPKARKRYTWDGALQGTGTGRRSKRPKKSKDSADVYDGIDGASFNAAVEPKLWAGDFESGDVATVGGRIYFAHPTEGICSVQHIALDQPYVARVWLKHAPTGHRHNDDVRQLDFSEFARLGFTVEYVFGNLPQVLNVDDGSFVDQNQMMDESSTTIHHQLLHEDERPVDEVMQAVESIQSPTKREPFKRSSIKRERAAGASPQRRHSMRQKQHIFACNKCAYEGKTDRALKLHTIKAHKDAKHAVSCSECGKQFLEQKTLDKHILHEHRAAPSYLCEECGGNFRSIGDLERHREFLHAQLENNFVHCSYCDNTFNSSFQCSLHMDDVHSRQMEILDPRASSSMDTSSGHIWKPG